MTTVLNDDVIKLAVNMAHKRFRDCLHAMEKKLEFYPTDFIKTRVLSQLFNAVIQGTLAAHLNLEKSKTDIKSGLMTANGDPIEIRVSSSGLSGILNNKVSKRTAFYILITWKKDKSNNPDKFKITGLYVGELRPSDWKPSGAKMNSTTLTENAKSNILREIPV